MTDRPVLEAVGEVLAECIAGMEDDLECYRTSDVLKDIYRRDAERLQEHLTARGLVICRRISPTPGASFAALPDGEVLIAHPDIPPHVWTGERMVPLDCYPLSWSAPTPIVNAGEGEA